MDPYWISLRAVHCTSRFRGDGAQCCDRSTLAPLNGPESCFRTCRTCSVTFLFPPLATLVERRSLAWRLGRGAVASGGYGSRSGRWGDRSLWQFKHARPHPRWYVLVSVFEWHGGPRNLLLTAQ